MARANAFCEHRFGIELAQLEVGAPQIARFPLDAQLSGPRQPRGGAGYRPSADGILIGFTTPDIEAAVERAAARSGEVIASTFSDGEYGFVARIRDFEGTRIGLRSGT